MKHILILCITLILSGNLFSQEERKIVIKKEKSVVIDNSDSEKEITVDVNVEEEDGMRVFTIKSSEDGEEKVMKWKDNGEIPAEIKDQLDAQGIDIQVLGGDQKAIFISEDSSTEEIRIRKEMDGDLEEEVDIEWDGKGEMPMDMKKMLEEHDIDLAELRKEGKDARVRIKKMHKDKAHGPHMWIEKKPGPHGKAMKGMPKVDVYMGAQIGPGEGGTGVLDVMVDSPAHKAGLKKGDVITEINGANTKDVDAMMMLLSLFDVGDTVEVQYSRGSKSKTAKIKLAPRPAPYR